MDDLISRKALLEIVGEMPTVWEYGNAVIDIYRIIKGQPAVDAVPIKPLSVWLAGYAMPPKYTVETNPVDSAKARAEGWEKHIRNLIECGLMEEE